MEPRAATANVLWAAGSLPVWRRFRSALARPDDVQRALILGYLRDNAGTVFGERHRFHRILTARDAVAAYQNEVPITTYDALEPDVRRVAAGESHVLTRAAVRRLTPSSGSTSAAKLLPHTDALAAEFSRAVDPWIADLYLKAPRLAGGPAYWSITPSVSFERCARARLGPVAPAIPVGFSEDSAYLGLVRQWLVSAALAVPGTIRLVADPGSFRYLTLLFLLRARGLRLISVWHPSFLTQLIEAIPSLLEPIANDVERGTLSPPGHLPGNVRQLLTRRMRPMPRRAAALRRVSGASLREIWPHLAVVSCWRDGPAGPYARRLSEALDGVRVQGKGLIATEAIVSIPFGDKHPLAITSHFLEFIDDFGRAHLAHELEPQRQYRVLVTTGGGLYRYDLGDRVEVTGRMGATPSIEFVGRGDRVSDKFGEKLSEGFVNAVLTDVFSGGAAPRFAMVIPETTSEGTAYTLLVEAEGPLPKGLQGKLEEGLRRNPHYAWCVDLGQLRPARVKTVGPNADRRYLDACVARGQRLGDVKPAALQIDDGWGGAFGV